MKKFILFTCIILVSLLSCNDDDSDTLRVNKTTLVFRNAVNEEIQIFNIESDDSWTIELETNNWLTLDKTSGQGDGVIKVTAQPNTSGKDEVLILIVKGSDTEIKITIKRTLKDIGGVESINILNSIPDINFKEYLVKWVFNGATFVTEEDAKSITSLYLSYKEIESLEGIHFFTKLRYLYCHHTQIKSLDLSKNKELRTLDCYNNELTTLDLKNCSNLYSLSCYNNKLERLNIIGCSELSTLDCHNNQLLRLDLFSKRLRSVICYDNPFLYGSVLVPKSVYDKASPRSFDPNIADPIYQVVD